MATEAEKKWLDGLGPGDEVCVPAWTGSTVNIYKVQRRTPAGFIVVNSTTYGRDGWKRGGDSWSRTHLREVTPELREKCERQSLIVKICDEARGDKLSKRTTDDLRRIWAAFGSVS